MTSTLHAADPHVAADPDPLDRPAVEAVVRAYFHASDAPDVGALEWAFHPALFMAWVGAEGTLQTLGRRTWAQRLVEAPPPPARVRRIASVFLDGDVATVHAHSEFTTHHFDDALTLLRLGGGWRVVVKTFHRRAPGDAEPAAGEASTDRAAVLEALSTWAGARGGGEDVHPEGVRVSVGSAELVSGTLRARADWTPPLGAPRDVWIAGSAAWARLPGERHVHLLRTSGRWTIVAVVSSGERHVPSAAHR